MEFDKVIVIDPGNTVVCDFCDDDFTNSDEQGGFLFQSKAVCPHCSEKMMVTVKKYDEEYFIRGTCPENTSFADWVRSIR